VDVDFQIFIYGYFRYLYLSKYFYYFESDGCHNLVSERVPSRLRPGMAIFGDLVLFGFDGFKRFQNIFRDLGTLKIKINSTFPFGITPS